ncbi:MAG: response regulator transcription factor [Armatimonadia bacterium]
MSYPIRVVLVDEHEIVRLGMRNLLKGAEGIEVVGEAEEKHTALEHIDQHHPDVVITGMVIGTTSGLELARYATRHNLRTRVVIFTMIDDHASVLEALQSGVAAYVLKSADAEEILRALRCVLMGYRYLSPPLRNHILDAYCRTAAAPVPAALAELTKREREIIALAADGLTNGQIGTQLHISPRTVEGHRSSAMRKLGLSNRVELVRFFVELEQRD